MAIFERGKSYWFHLHWNGEHVQRGTRQDNPRSARPIEAAGRMALAKGEAGVVERKPASTYREFAEQFRKSVETKCADRPSTVEFYALKMARLLEFSPLASAPLDQIDEAMIDSYVQHRRQTVSPATVNRKLATLRKGLRLAY